MLAFTMFINCDLNAAILWLQPANIQVVNIYHLTFFRCISMYFLLFHLLIHNVFFLVQAYLTIENGLRYTIVISILECLSFLLVTVMQNVKHVNIMVEQFYLLAGVILGIGAAKRSILSLLFYYFLFFIDYIR